jgi:hypothetical protein
MPSQELYLEKKAGLDTFQVIKSYDTAFAKEAFASMDEVAIEHLSASLAISGEYASDEMPTSPDGLTDLVWEAMYDSANEFGQTKSYFIVRRTSTAGEDFLYVSGDWPSAESYVKLVAVA